VVTAALAEGVDWRLAQELCRRHRITALFVEGLNFHGIGSPEPFCTQMKNTAQREALRELGMLQELQRLLSLMDGAGLRVQLLKGLGLSYTAYGRLGLRYNRDIDLLVGPEEAPAAMAVLTKAGYAVAEPAGFVGDRLPDGWMDNRKDVTLVNRVTGDIVELHWRLFTNPTLASRCSSEAVLVTLPGAVHTVMLEPEANFIFLCVHGAEHAWSRLKWLLDVHAIAAALPTTQLEAFYRSAKARGVHRSVAQAFVLMDRLFGLPTPPSVRRDYRFDLRVRALVFISRRTMMRGGAREIEELPFGSTLKAVGRYLILSGAKSLKEQVLFDLYHNSHERGGPGGQSLHHVIGSRVWRWAGANMRRRRSGS
jgi:hypothetical protein